MLESNKDLKRDTTIKVYCPNDVAFEAKIVRRLNFGYYYVLYFLDFGLHLIVSCDELCGGDHFHLTPKQFDWLNRQCVQMILH